MSADHSTETVLVMATKVAPPATISLATIFGYQVSELVLWATLIYTVLMIGHKVLQIVKEVKED